MRKLNPGMVATVILLLAHAGWTESGQTEPPIRLELELIDGSRILGAPKLESVQLKTPYAKMNIALEEILEISMIDDHRTAMLEMWNGDKITGAVDLKSLKIKTIFGAATIPIDTVQTIQVLSYKNPAYRFEIDESDNIHDKLKDVSFSRPAPSSQRYSETGPGWTTIKIDVRNRIIADRLKHDYVVSADYIEGADCYHIKNFYLEIDGQRYRDMAPEAHPPDYNYIEGSKRDPSRHLTTGFITSVPPLKSCKSAQLTFDLSDDVFPGNEFNGGDGTTVAIGFAAIPDPGGD